VSGNVVDRRLRWRCRRGTRELDLILERFLSVAGDTLDEDGCAGFERLLDQPDQDILDWIAGRSPAPPDTGMATLLERIRSVSDGAGNGP